MMNNIPRKLKRPDNNKAASSFQKPVFSMRRTLLVIAIAQALTVPNAQAATIVVDNGGDVDTGCTLREAVTSINTGSVGATGCSNSGGAFDTDDQITFSVATVSLSNGELDINKDLSIDGGGTGVTINGDGSSRLLKLDAGSTTTVSLNNLTLSSGSSSLFGGAIYARDISLKLSNCTLSGNSAYGGGAIFLTDGSMSLSNCTLSGNSASYFGGGIFPSSFNVVSLSNCTLSGNSAHIGGGISIPWGGESMSLSNSTLSGNSAHNGGGIYVAGGGSKRVSLSNSIIANSGGHDCFTSPHVLSADSHNIIEDGSCSTSAISVDPKLGALANNGGPTQTHALLSGSPAVDAGDNVTCAATPVNNLDQRGETRPLGSACDIGAYELSASGEVCGLPMGRRGVMLRDVAAEWLGRCVHGPSFDPGFTSSAYTDVADMAYNVAWIEQFRLDLSTEGCDDSNTLYCPKDPLSKTQAVKLILRSKHGGSHTPPVATEAPFDDVPLGHLDIDWISEAKAEGFTSGCGDGSNFCIGEILSERGFQKMLDEAL